MRAYVACRAAMEEFLKDARTKGLVSESEVPPLYVEFHKEVEELLTDGFLKC